MEGGHIEEAPCAIDLKKDLPPRVCVTNALNNKEDMGHKCAMTWGNVLHRCKQWGAYRAPFQMQMHRGRLWPTLATLQFHLALVGFQVVQRAVQQLLDAFWPLSRR